MGRLVAAALAAVVVGAMAAEAGPQPQRRKWWQDDKLKAEIGLTDQQSAEVEEVFQGAIPKLRSLKQQLDTLEADLSRLIRERTAEEQLVAAQIDRVEATRAELSKTRTLMLYRIHRLLSPEQNARLQAVYDRQKDRGRDSRRPQ
ncbi:MAG TPA: periplasmic heavy metal sensor [Vicinamibacterales bacterium]|nr:periplasmic heavy metal sensor [Vicinamibacterales bacterium]